MQLQVTSALDQSRSNHSEVSNLNQTDVNGRNSKKALDVSEEDSPDNDDEEEEEEEDRTKDCRKSSRERKVRSSHVTSQNINLHENKSSTIESSSEVPGSSDNVSEVGHNDELNDDDNPVTSENVSQSGSGRPRRSAGRSLFERNPDFALGREFAKILRQKSIKETSRLKKVRKRLNDERRAADSSKVEVSPTEDQGEPVIGGHNGGEVEAEEGWRSSDFRSQQLSRLDLALSSAGWSAAISSGKNLEDRVYNDSNSEAHYVSGIQKLIKHFNKGSISKQVNSDTLPVKMSSKSQNIPVKNKRVVKPTRKILDGLDFRRKVATPKISCSECGDKFAKSKLKLHIENVHSPPEKEGEKDEAGGDNSSMTSGSEVSLSSAGARARAPRSVSRTPSAASLSDKPQHDTEISRKVNINQHFINFVCLFMIHNFFWLSDSRRVCWKLFRERGVRGLVRPRLHLRTLPPQQLRGLGPESEHGPRLRAGQQPSPGADSGQQRRGRGRGQPRPAAAEEEVHGGAASGLCAAAPSQSREKQSFRFSTASGSEEDQE